MNGKHSTDPKGDQRTDVAQEWFQKDRTIINGIGQRGHETESAELTSTTMVVRRKTRRKDKGPLTLCCEWVVEHQIGK